MNHLVFYGFCYIGCNQATPHFWSNHCLVQPPFIWRALSLTWKIPMFAHNCKWENQDWQMSLFTYSKCHKTNLQSHESAISYIIKAVTLETLGVFSKERTQFKKHSESRLSPAEYQQCMWFSHFGLRVYPDKEWFVV